MEQQNKIIVNEITVKGQRFVHLMNYINDLPHRFGKELEAFIFEVAQENQAEKEPPQEIHTD